MLRVFVLVVVCGCRQLAGLDDPLPGDDAPPGSSCFGAGLIRVCLDDPTGDLTLDSPIATDTSPLCSTTVVSGGDGACVIAANTITVPAAANVRATGTRPLLLIGAASITVTGDLDVSSVRGQQGGRGAAANFSGCDGPAQASGSGGGAGGSFGGTGGPGGNPGQSTPGAPLSAPTTLHGGCPGQDGGGQEGGRNGDGGGAIYLIGGDSISIAGTIDASGSGGGGVHENLTSGGGGGGSGGMIGLDAPSISIGGLVFANGGGGGEGGTAAEQGNDGHDPAGGDAGTGGSGQGAGGDGGDGGAKAAKDGKPGGDGSGAGGGGGSVGAILVTGTRTGSGLVSPDPL